MGPNQAVTPEPTQAATAKRAVAALLHWDREHLGKLLRDEIQSREKELREFGGLLKLPDSILKRLEARRSATIAAEGGGLDLDIDTAHADGLYMLNQWGADLPLTSAGTAVRQVDTAPPPAAGEFARHVADFPDADGTITIATHIGGADWHESPKQATYRIDVSACDYAHALATRAHVHADVDLRAQITDAAASADVGRILRLAPYSLIGTNINLVASDDKFLVAKRSPIVRTHKNEWNVGINEGMKVTGPGERTEDFFGAARRGLAEELALHADAIDEVVVNWFGYCVDCCNFYAFAHARTPYSSGEIKNRRSRARDARELGRVDFLALTEAQLTSATRPSPSHDPTGRWLHHARLSAQLLWAALDQLT